MLKSFTVKNFRNLNIEDLELNRINLFIGPNNSGKSNLIDALSFCSELIISEKVRSSGYDTSFYEVLYKHGFGDILKRDIEKPGEIEMSWVITTDKRYQDLRYELKFQVGDQFPEDFYITNEKLRYNKPVEGKIEPYRFYSCHEDVVGKGEFSTLDLNKQGRKALLDVKSSETVFGQMWTLLDSEEFLEDVYPAFKNVVKSVKWFFERYRTYSSTDFDMRTIREPRGKEIQFKYLTSNGENFINVVDHLDNVCGFIEQFKETLQEIMPKLKNVEIVTESDGKKHLQFCFKDRVFKQYEMSDGTIKAMLLALLLTTPEKMTILSLDEPELNLHPAWLKVVAGWVLRSNSADQIFISTHSPDFLDTFTAEFREWRVSLFVCDLKEEQTVKRILPERLDKFLQEGWELGDLYRVGEPRLGGWPW